MRPLHRLQNVLTAALPLLALGGLAGEAAAQYAGTGYNPYYYSNQTYTYGLHLPQVPVQNGQDEIRGADGTTCRSSMGNNSAYLDIGAIGAQGYGGEVDSGTFYGRLIVPLGQTPKRIDCTKLYDLEITRLKHELQLARAGLGNLDRTGSSGPAPRAQYASTGELVPASAEGAAPTVVPSKTAKSPKPSGSATSSRSTNTAKKKSGWSDDGWSTSGWQQRSQLGAPVARGEEDEGGQTERRVVRRQVPPRAAMPDARAEAARGSLAPVAEAQLTGWMPVVTINARGAE